MNSFFGIAKDSLEVFSENPKLILPKLLVSFLYSITMILTASFVVGALKSPDLSSLFLGIAIIFLEVVFLLVDAFVNVMFPFLVKQHYGGRKASLKEAFGFAAKNWMAMVPAIVVFACFAAIAVFSTFVYMGFFYGGESIDLAIGSMMPFMLLFAIVVVFLFYLVFPVSALESNGIIGSLRRTVSLSISNWAGAAKAVALSLLLSVLSFAIAFAINVVPEDNAAFFWSAFIIVRFLTAYISTYLYILSPVFYFGCAGIIARPLDLAAESNPKKTLGHARSKSGVGSLNAKFGRK